MESIFPNLPAIISALGAIITGFLRIINTPKTKKPTLKSSVSKKMKKQKANVEQIILQLFMVSCGQFCMSLMQTAYI